MKRLSIILIITLFESVILGQKVDILTAEKAAVTDFVMHNQAIAPSVSKITPFGVTNDTSFYVVEFEKRGFVIVSAYRSAPPILGQCFTDTFDQKSMPPGLLYLLEKYKYGIQELKSLGIKPTKVIEKKWEQILSTDNLSPKSYTVGNYLVQTNWNQSGDYAMYASEEHPIGCTGVAMAQILHYWSCRIDGQLNDYLWINMALDSANTYNAQLIYDCCLSCETTPNHISNPWKARDGFEDDFGISSSANVKWRIWHLSNWEDMLKSEVDLGRPLLYSGGNFELDGHSWVIDGYNQDDQFHCNWGWGGAYNQFYSLGNFNPGGLGLNQMESAIFNVEPVEPAGVGTPTIASQAFTYNTNGYSLSIPDVFGATSYQWTTQYGTVIGSGNSPMLLSDRTTTVQVRAYNNRCQIYSPYTSALVTVNYGPISGPSTVCSTNATYSLSNIPLTASVTWNFSNNLSHVNHSNSSCTVISNGTGAGWLEATIYPSSGGSFTLPKYFVQVHPVYNFISTEYDQDCNTVTLTTNLPSYTSVTWNASSNFLIDGYYPPLSKQGNSIIVTSTDGNGGSVYGTTSLGCSITPYTTFCPCQSWSGASITWIWACPSPGEPLIAEVSPLHPDATEYKWYIGDQLIETTYDGYLQTYNWPCTSEMPHLYVTGVTSCGHTELIDGGEFFPACGGYKSSSNVILYPNPASSEVTIALEEKQSPVNLISGEIQINSLSEITQVKLIDNTGMTRKLMNFGKSTTKLSFPLSEIQAGVYYLDVTDGEHHVIKPLTIKK